jgi:hypothetical protein
VRHKWYFKDSNFQIGDIVLVTSESLNRSEWPLGRVIRTYPDTDGIVRKVDVKIMKGKVLRDIRSLCLLEGVEVNNPS